MVRVSKPYKNCKPSDLTQGFKPDHLANDWASVYGTFLVAPFNAKVIVIRGVQNPQDIVVGDNSYLQGGNGIRLQSIEDPTLTMVYWHCLPTFPVQVGDAVDQGTPVAEMGNSGFVMAGGKYVELNLRDIPPYPGTHTHWTMGRNNPDGTYTPLDPSTLIDWSIPVVYDAVTAIRALIQKIVNLLNGR